VQNTHGERKHRLDRFMEVVPPQVLLGSSCCWFFVQNGSWPTFPVGPLESGHSIRSLSQRCVLCLRGLVSSPADSCRRPIGHPGWYRCGKPFRCRTPDCGNPRRSNCLSGPSAAETSIERSPEKIACYLVCYKSHHHFNRACTGSHVGFYPPNPVHRMSLRTPDSQSAPLPVQLWGFVLRAQPFASVPVSLLI
jgi:hypothetical protein